MNTMPNVDVPLQPQRRQVLSRLATFCSVLFLDVHMSPAAVSVVLRVRCDIGLSLTQDLHVQDMCKDTSFDLYMASASQELKFLDSLTCYPVYVVCHRVC